MSGYGQKEVDLSTENHFSPDFYTQKMIDYIESSREDGRPFLAWVGYQTVHYPHQASTDTSACRLLTGRPDKIHPDTESLGYELAGRNTIFRRDYKLSVNLPPNLQHTRPCPTLSDIQPFQPHPI